MKRTILVAMVTATLLATFAIGGSFIYHAQKEKDLCCPAAQLSESATCSPTGTCNACKNCKYCKNCSKDGGSCSVCAPSKKK